MPFITCYLNLQKDWLNCAKAVSFKLVSGDNSFEEQFFSQILNRFSPNFPQKTNSLPRTNFARKVPCEVRLPNRQIPVIGRSASLQFGMQLFAARTAQSNN